MEFSTRIKLLKEIIQAIYWSMGFTSDILQINKENSTINNTESLYLKCGNHQTYNSNTENNGEGNQKLKRNQIFLLLGMSSINFFVSTNLSLPGPFFPGEVSKLLSRQICLYADLQINARVPHSAKV